MQLVDALCWHLHIFCVLLMADRFDKLDGRVKVPAHKVRNLPTNAHVGAILLFSELHLQI